MTILLSSIPLQSIFAETFSFNSSQNLSNTGASSTIPQIISSGNDVYVIWKDGTDILFANSTDNRTTFDAASDLGDTGTSSGFPQISVSGNNVYGVWEDNNEIKFRASTNNGDFFNAEIQLSSLSSVLSATEPQISSTANNVHVVWEEGSDIFFRSSSNSGATFVPDASTNDPIDLGDSTSSVGDPQITSSGTNVYVVWQDGNDIRFINSTDNGATFSSPAADIGDSTGTSTASKPQLTVSGNNVYVVWQQNFQIKLARSIDNGATFDSPIVVGSTSGQIDSTPQITSSGNKIYVTWREGTGASSEIKFRVYTESGGLNPSSEINLSNSSGESKNPQIAASGNDVRVTWQDTMFGNPDVVFSASNDDGASFGNVQNLSSTSSTSTDPQIANSGSNVYVVWKEPSPGNNEIFFISGTPSPVNVSFDQNNYKLSETATITVNDAGASGSVFVTVTSDTDATGITNLTLTETGVGTGVFTGQVTFSTSSTSGNTLHVSVGDNIQVNYSGQNDSASIFSRSITFNDSVIDRGDVVNIEVNDNNANLNPLVTETVTVNLSTDSDAISLTLTETGIDTGVFGGTSGPTKSSLIFMIGNDLAGVGSVMGVSSEEPGSNSTSGIDATNIQVTSDSDLVGIILPLTETSGISAIFEGSFTINSTGSIAGSHIHAVPGDIITVLGNNGLNANMLVTPNPNPANGAIQVDPPIDQVTTTDNLVATYEDVQISQPILQSPGESGGGGGGIIRPGLVVNVLAGASALGGGGSGPPGPTITLGALALYDAASERISLPDEIRQMLLNHDPHVPLEPLEDIYEDFDFPLSINGKGFALGGYENTLLPQSIKRGEPTIFQIVFYTNSEIAHTSLYFNLGPTRTIDGSDTQVLIYKDESVQIIDPNGNIAHATATINNEGDLKRVVTFSITFSDDIQWTDSDLIIRSWNDDLNSGDTIVYNAITIEPSQQQIAFEESIPEPEVEQLTSLHVPIWIKNNAAWWSDGLIEDADFVAGIEYLIQSKIITIQDNQIIASSYSADDIPDWIKHNAGWWSDDLITEKEFIDAIQWLISNGVIQVIET